MNPHDAWFFHRLIAGKPLDGAEPPTSGPFVTIAGQFAGLPADDRQPAWDDFLDELPDGAAIAQTVAEANHKAPALEADDDEAPEGWGPIRLAHMPAAKPFPTDVLCLEAREIVEAAAQSIGCPTDAPALACLCAASAAIGQSVNLFIKPGYCETAALYGVLVADASGGKSPSNRLIMPPIKERERRYMIEFDRVYNDWELADKGDRGPEPTPMRTYVTDATTEALGPILAANPRGVIFLPDELPFLLSGMNQYKGGSGNDRQFYLLSWGSESLGRDRINTKGRPRRVEAPFLTIEGGIQPAKLPELIGGLADGFTPRFLFAFPEIVEVNADEDEDEEGVADHIAESWSWLINRLFDRPMREDDGRQVPQLVRMSPEAKEARKEWKREHKRETLAPDFRSERLGSYWGKLRAYHARLSLILHLMNEASNPTTSPTDELPPIPRQTVEAAGRLIDYFKTSFLRAYAGMGGKLVDGGEDCRILIRWIVNGLRTSFSERDITRDLAALRGDDQALMATLRWMTDHNLIRPEPQPDRPKSKRGRKPSRRYEVNPALLTDPRCLRIAGRVEATQGQTESAA